MNANSVLEIIEELINARRDHIYDDRSLYSLIRNPSQDQFEKTTEVPVSPFTTGFKDASLVDLFKFCDTKFSMGRDSKQNIAPDVFAVLDKRSIEVVEPDDRQRTVVLVQVINGKLDSTRAKFAIASLYLQGMSVQETTITGHREMGEINERGVM